MLGFQFANGKTAFNDDRPMIVDLFDDPAFALAREAVEYASMLRGMGELEPALLGPEDMEYTTLRQVLRNLKGRFKSA